MHLDLNLRAFAARLVNVQSIDVANYFHGVKPTVRHKLLHRLMLIIVKSIVNDIGL